jgi:hypothetical protein
MLVELDIACLPLCLPCLPPTTGISSTQGQERSRPASPGVKCGLSSPSPGQCPRDGRHVPWTHLKWATQPACPSAPSAAAACDSLHCSTQGPGGLLSNIFLVEYNVTSTGVPPTARVRLSNTIRLYSRLPEGGGDRREDGPDPTIMHLELQTSCNSCPTVQPSRTPASTTLLHKLVQYLEQTTRHIILFTG